MKKQKLRSEIDNKYKWDLTKIFKSETEFLEELDRINEEIKKISSYEDKFMSSAKSLYDFLKFLDKLEMNIERLHSYAHQKYDEDTTNSNSLKNNELVKNLYDDYTRLTGFVHPNFMKYDYDLIEKYYKEYPELKEYEFTLYNIYKYKEHMLDDNTEKVLSSMSKAFDRSDEVFETLNDSDLTFGNIIKDGKEIELTKSNYGIFIEDLDREVRKQTFETLYKEYKKYSNTFAKCFSNYINLNNTISRIRKYKSSRERALFEDNVSEEVYDNLIETVSNNLTPLFKYFKIKKNILNLDELHLYDTYIPVVSELNKNYTYEEARDIVKKALSPLGEDYLKVLDKAFTEGWIDVYNNKGKRGGAYSGGSYLTNPYVLLNFEGRLDDVSTIAHELGHSIHSFYSIKNNNYNNWQYTIFVAEVASTVNEILLNNYIINKSKDDKERLYALNNLLDLYKSTLFRQTMFAEFERDMYNDSAKGEILTSDYLCDKYYKLNEKYFGKDVVIDDLIRYEWSRIPHFYYNFYLYMYATSISASTYIANEIISGNTKLRDQYLHFLTLGGRMYPIDELKTVGVDMTKKEVVEEAISYFSRLVDEFEVLSKKGDKLWQKKIIMKP